MNPDRSTKIGLVFSYSLGYCRSVLRGIKEFAETRDDWVFTPVEPDPEAIETLRSIRPSGVIAHVYRTDVAESLLSLGVPVVNVSGVLTDVSIPTVSVDDQRIGELAAEHFLERGFENFAFVGHRDHGYSIRRESGYRKRLEPLGYSVCSYHERESAPFSPRGRLWGVDADVRDWLVGLARPAGIFAPNDLWGLQLTEVCRRTALKLPEEIAIVGVDDDDLLCELARPSLSSVALPGVRIGVEAAALLDRLIVRPRFKPPNNPLLLPPIEVVTRRSSDVLAIADADVAAAVRYIRNHARDPIQVEDVLRSVPVSRRLLERKFRAILGVGPGEEIRRARIALAKRHLSRTEAPMTEVARLSGFADQRRLAAVFRQETGFTPTSYRARFRRRL